MQLVCPQGQPLQPVLCLAVPAADTTCSIGEEVQGQSFHSGNHQVLGECHIMRGRSSCGRCGNGGSTARYPERPKMAASLHPLGTVLIAVLSHCLAVPGGQDLSPQHTSRTHPFGSRLILCCHCAWLSQESRT